MATENDLRKEQIKRALINAFELVSANDWSEAMSKIQEAEIITRVILDQKYQPEPARLTKEGAR